MEERTGAEFPTAGSTSGLSNLEATERGDTGFRGGGYQNEGFRGEEQGGGMREKVSSKAHQFASQHAGQAKKVGGVAKDKAFKSIEGRKSYFASELDNFAGTLEEVSRTLENRGNGSQQQLVDKGARYVRQASQMLRDRSTEELFDQAQTQLRERPTVAIAGALALGFLGVRLLRS
jgi:hypothetical protein